MNVKEYYYNLLKKECEKLDAVYEDYIIKQIGIAGLRILKQSGLLEPCGVINGRQLYVLTKK